MQSGHGVKRLAVKTSIFFLIAVALVVVTAWLSPLATAQTPAATPAQVEARVNSILGKLTLAQKLDLIGGDRAFFIRAEPSAGLPEIKMADGPIGVRNWGQSTAYPAGIALAASWDTQLAYDYGVALGQDARARGVHIMLGPGVNIYRAPMNGRNFEYFGEDPYLASRIAVNWIEGLQSQGVSATVKHYALNNSEFDRHNLSSDVDERTLHEIYLPTFRAAVEEAHVGAIMDSYNLVNGVHATQSGLLNNEIAKKQFGFDGVIMSDWDATYDGVAAANNGLDLEMPSAKFMDAKTLTAALNAGTLSMATLDDKIRRIVRLEVRMGWLDRDQEIASLPKDNPKSREVAHRAALESIVLLKNDANLLPLASKNICTLAVIGPHGDASFVEGGGSAHVVPVASISMVDALKAALPPNSGAGCKGVVFERGLATNAEIFQTTQFDKGGLTEMVYDNDSMKGQPTVRQVTHLVPSGAPPAPNSDAPMKSAHWTGLFMPKSAGPQVIVVSAGRNEPFTLTVNGREAVVVRKRQGRPIRTIIVDASPDRPLQLDMTGQFTTTTERFGLGVRSLNEMVSPAAKDLAAKADAVLLAVSHDDATESEGSDRTFALPTGEDELIQTVAAINKKTIVTITAGGNVDMNAWFAQVPALLHLWYPGEEGAPALAQILFGAANPEGHLPASFERSWADNPVHDNYYPVAGGSGTPHVAYKEGVFLGYRYYAGAQTKPLFPFGFGLSYTTFAFSHLQVRKTAAGATVSFDVKNTGTVAGAEVAQVYVGDPSATIKRPVEELKAFKKVRLAPNQSEHVEMTLNRSAFSYWSEGKHDWTVDPGKFVIMAGDSSENLPLHREIEYSGGR